MRSSAFVCIARASPSHGRSRSPASWPSERVGTAILFESSGGQVDKVAHLPELRFALGEPEVDTTSVDNAAIALEDRAFFVRRVGTDGFQIRHQPTLKKVVNDRRASLDEEGKVRPAVHAVVKQEFERGASLQPLLFPEDISAVPDSPRLTVVVADPEWELEPDNGLRARIAEWTRKRGQSDRLYPGSLIWCVRKPGRDLRDAVEELLAWKRVQREVKEGTLGSDFDRSDLADIDQKVRQAVEEAKDEVWAGYCYVALAESSAPEGLRIIDLGAGHASASETLYGRVIATLKSEALLNESVGAGYIDGNWPPALVDSGAWPLTSLRQSFLNGAVTRLVDPDKVLKAKIVEFVDNGDFGLASGPKGDVDYEHHWFEEMVPSEEVAFENGVFLLKKAAAKRLKERKPRPPESAGFEAADTGARAEDGAGADMPLLDPPPDRAEAPGVAAPAGERLLRLVGELPPELWNRLGTKVLPKLRSGNDLAVRVELSASLPADSARYVESDLRQILEDLGLTGKIRIE